MDYEVRDKLFVEALFDIEFSDSPGRGVLYVGKLWFHLHIVFNFHFAKRGSIPQTKNHYILDHVTKSEQNFEF